MVEMKLIPFKVQSVEDTPGERPYGINQIKAPEMWDKGERGKGVVVAILDTGVDITHPDLKDRIIDGRNFTIKLR
jgi:major intracellular serine protease